jgi:hypothetical protein
VPTLPLPSPASLAQFEQLADEFLRLVRSHDAEALEAVREFHPHPAVMTSFTRPDAQLVVARRYGFASWPKLRRYAEGA